MSNVISLESVRKVAPSVFAKTAHPKMSERYLFLSTADIIAPLMEEGYVITQATQRATRSNGRNPAFTRHMVRLRETTAKPVVGDVFPEVVISNAHDGQAKLSIWGGLFRLVCSNGMVTGFGGSHTAGVFRHVGDAEVIRTNIKDCVAKSKSTLTIVKRLSKTVLTQAQQEKFAADAIRATWDEDKFDPSLVLEAKREEDKGNDAWRVFNRVQENLIRGGVRFPSSDSDRVHMTRGITHIGRSIELNVALWDLMKSYADAA